MEDLEIWLQTLSLLWSRTDEDVGKRQGEMDRLLPSMLSSRWEASGHGCTGSSSDLC